MLYQLDKKSSCEIIPLYDFGFPHDVIRIAGGFPTGIFLKWECKIPFLPIDTTVNVCSTTIFELDSDILENISEEFIYKFKDKIDKSEYKYNFDRGNHFISFCESTTTHKNYLILHSSAAEFKKGFSGLYPVEDNWFCNDIKVFHENDRYIRYIVGSKAELFWQMANQLINFNQVRHRFFGEVIVDGLCKILNEKIFHHYYMPTNQSVAIGCHLVKQNEIFPFLTYPGHPIFFIKILKSTENKILLNEKSFHLLPHGWGKESKIKPIIKVDYFKKEFILNELKFPINSYESLRNHPDLQLRKFSINPYEKNFFFNLIKDKIKLKIIDTLNQKISISKLGLKRW